MANAVQESLNKADSALQEHQDISGLATKQEVNAKYTKPSEGIPKNALASSVQTSLGLPDTALQTETDPTVPSWAKQTTKPVYTAEEVGALPIDTPVPEIDSTLTQSGEAADAKAVGDAISLLSSEKADTTYVDTAIQTAIGNAIGGEY